MRSRLWLGLAAALVVLPTAAAALVATRVLPVEGGHGLASWFVLSACAVAVLAGVALSAVAGRADARSRRIAAGIACTGIASLLVFLFVYGLPFAR